MPKTLDDGRAVKPMSGQALRWWIGRGVVAGLVVAVVGVLVLETLRLVAHRRGVVAGEFAPGSEIRRRAVGADYVDAYTVDVPPGMDPTDTAFGMGRQVFSDSAETIWEGTAPGLRFLASHHLTSGHPRRITFSTAVFYETMLGPVYFFPVRFVHRRGVPFMVSRMVR